jgi:hypothetical protein
MDFGSWVFASVGSLGRGFVGSGNFKPSNVLTI